MSRPALVFVAILLCGVGEARAIRPLSRNAARPEGGLFRRARLPALAIMSALLLSGCAGPRTSERCVAGVVGVFPVIVPFMVCDDKPAKGTDAKRPTSQSAPHRTTPQRSPPPRHGPLHDYAEGL